MYQTVNFTDISNGIPKVVKPTKAEPDKVLILACPK
jgi:hypothetical protein